MEKHAFTSLLMGWHFNHNHRQMPWKGEKNPYKVWLSEVILQQTRVEQGLGYFERFITRYSDINALAEANDEEVFKLWEGLGYYNRCKNLLATARLVADKYKGVFPADYQTILSLKGVGAYTAAAIASFCFNLAYPVIDGNVLRVLARVFGIETPVDGKEAKNIFYGLAEKLLDKNNPGAFNQAIMDFGATVCKPALPLCANCTLQKICGAHKTGRVNVLPAKEKALTRKTRWFTYFIFERDHKVLVRKRTGKDIWQNLFEFYLIETPDNPKWNESLVEQWLNNQLGITAGGGVKIVAAERQQLTHQEIKGYFIGLDLVNVAAPLQLNGSQWLAKSALAQLPFPAFINQYLRQNCHQPQLFNC
jgi:A/G-specific adenine glycosylase